MAMIRLIATIFVPIILSSAFLSVASDGTVNNDLVNSRVLQRQNKTCKEGRYYDEELGACQTIPTCKSQKRFFDSSKKKCVKCPAKKGKLYSPALLRCQRVCPASDDIVYQKKKRKCKCQAKKKRFRKKLGACVCKKGLKKVTQDDGGFICKARTAAPVEVQVCRFDEFGNFETATEDSVSDLMPNDVMGSCEVNCPDICFDDDFCTTDVDETSPTCACADPPVPLVVGAGEKCCAPDGNIIPLDACCPIGDDACCGLSIEECLQTINPFQAKLAKKALGAPPEDAEVPPLPFFSISDAESIQAAVPGVYNAATTYGQEFTFEVVEILQNARQFEETFFDPAVDEELLDFFADLDNQTSLELLLKNSSSDFSDFVDGREFSSYSETILNVLDEPTESDVLDTFTESDSQSVVFLGRFDMGGDLFVGLADSFNDIAGVRVAFLLIVSDPDAFSAGELSRRDRRLVILPSACSEAVNAAESAARMACENESDDHEFQVDEGCKAEIISTCQNEIADAQAVFEAAVKEAEDIKRAGEAALVLWKARAYAKCINARGCFALRHPYAVAACIAICSAFIEGRAFLVKRALEEAFEFAIKIAEEKRDAIQSAVVSAAQSAGDGCFRCECPEGECCPRCEGMDLCCEGACISSDECCPTCRGTDQCCEGNCVAEDQCCPACMGGNTCCEGTCIGPDACCSRGTVGCPFGLQCCEGSCVSNDGCCPACGSSQKCCDGQCIPSDDCCEPLAGRKLRGFEEDVDFAGRKLQLDPCCVDPEDPCCGSEDPCCSSEDPCCASEDPCCGSFDPCCGSEDPCCGSDDACCGQSDCGGSTGDPHMYTFDGLRYDCQGRGDFILIAAGDAMVQARFRKVFALAAVTAGFAVSEGPDSSTVEVSMPVAGGEPVLVVDGTIIESPSDGYEDDSVIVVNTEASVLGTFRVTYKASSLSVYARYFLFDNYLNVRVGLPSSLRAAGTVGLLGSADNNVTNDWMTPDGVFFPIPTSRRERIAPSALSYCLSWCIRNETDSLFTYYEAGTNFSSLSGCDGDSGEVVDISNPTPEAADLCGLDEACLVDALGFGLGVARETLQEQAETANVFTTDSLLANPASIPTGKTVNVALTVRLSPSDLADGVAEFVVYRLDSVTAEAETKRLLTLREAVPGDRKFTNVISVLSDMAGEEFGFQAVPVIFGIEDLTSSLVIRRLVAVRSYSEASGIDVGNDYLDCGATPCDDGDPCTVDFCLNDGCSAEPVACGTDESCDPFTGRCQDIQNLVPCVAVIDEWENRAYNDEWSTFRATFPHRPFCLLVANTVVPTLPAGFDMDTVNNPDGVDRTVQARVWRDEGDPVAFSDWFTSCELGRLSPANVRFVALFVDNSDTMDMSSVQSSFEKFTVDAANAGLTIVTVAGPSKRWIDPFLTTLSP